MRVLQPRTGHGCERVREWISLELDDELSRIERALVQRHVASCPDCAAFGVRVAAFTTALRAAPLESLDQPVALPVRRRLQVRTAQVAAVAAVAVGAVGIATLSSSIQERVGSSITPAADAQVDQSPTSDQLRHRQLAQLTERIAQVAPRPLGTQPV